MYANLTQDQKDNIVASFRMWRSLGCTPEHATACAVDGLKLSKRVGEKTKTNAWAAVLATLTMAREITIGEKATSNI